MSTTPVTPVSSVENPYAAVRTDFRQLTQSIQKGDLSGAQAAYQAIQQSGVTPPANSPLANDLSAIGQALQSGDITSAQQALTTLQSDAQAGAKTHHGHRHHHHSGSNQTSDQTPALDPTATVGANVQVRA